MTIRTPLLLGIILCYAEVSGLASNMNPLNKKEVLNWAQDNLEFKNKDDCATFGKPCNPIAGPHCCEPNVCRVSLSNPDLAICGNCLTEGATGCNLLGAPCCKGFYCDASSGCQSTACLKEGSSCTVGAVGSVGSACCQDLFCDTGAVILGSGTCKKRQ